jgi:hypothetical protein
MEVEVEGSAAVEAEISHGIEPGLHKLRVAGGRDTAAVFREEGALGDGVEACEEGQSLVKHRGHDVTVAGAAEELERQERAYRTTGGDHL